MPSQHESAEPRAAAVALRNGLVGMLLVLSILILAILGWRVSRPLVE